jgi:hypothetical protein
MADGITFDKATYAPGDTVTATIVASTRKKTSTATFDMGGGNVLTGQLTIQANGTLSDTGNHTWTKVSDDGTTAVYTTKA